MTDLYVEDEINLRDYWRVLVRRRFLVLGITFVTTLIIAIIVLRLPNIYQSKTTLMPLGKSAGGLQRAFGDLGGLLPLASLNQENPAERILAILNSRTLAEDVIQRLDLLPRLFERDWSSDKLQWITDKPPTMHDAARKLKELVAINSDGTRGIITIAVEHTDPDLAAVISNQYVEALRRILDDNAFSLAKKNRLFIEAQLRQTRDALNASEEALRSFEQKHGIVSLDVQTAASMFSLNQAPEIKLRYTRLQRDILLQNKLFTLLAEQLAQAKMEEAQDETAFQVLDRAISPHKHIKPRRRLSVLLGIAVGGLLGIFSAFLREHLDTAIYTREQLEHRLKMDVLAIIPPPVLQERFHHNKRALRSSEAVHILDCSPEEPLLEAYRYLYTRLKHFNGRHRMQTVLFVSPLQDNNVSTVLANLAITAANLGDKTLLLDGNFRQPVLHELLQCSVSPGLAQILNEPDDWQKSVQTTCVDKLYLLPAGTEFKTKFAFLGSTAFEVILTEFKETYDLILCTAPPILDHADSAILGGKIDATCLVLTYGVSRIETTIEAKAMLEAVEANVIGTVAVY